MSRYQVLEVSDSRDFCECCGKQGLKRVVFIEDTETNDIKHFGTTCAMTPAKGFALDKEIKDAVRRWDDRLKAIAKVAYYTYRDAGGKFETHPTKAGVWRPADKALYDQVYQRVAA